MIEFARWCHKLGYDVQFSMEQGKTAPFDLVLSLVVRNRTTTKLARAQSKIDKMSDGLSVIDLIESATNHLILSIKSSIKEEKV